MNAQTNTQDETRARWMSILAKSDFSDFESLVEPPIEPGRPFAARDGHGHGARQDRRRCAVQFGRDDGHTLCDPLAQGPTGFGYVAGRNTKHAELAAVVDAMMQISSSRRTLEQSLIMPPELCASARREKRAERPPRRKSTSSLWSGERTDEHASPRA